MNREQLLESLRRSGTPADVLRAMETVSREKFVPASSASRAWEDSALFLAHGSTISQPAMVAVVLQEMQLASGLRVLEIGSGSGYLVALLAAMGVDAVGIEIDESLAASSREVLGDTATVIAGDAARVEREGPYDRIVFSAALTDVPQWAVAELTAGGFVLAPVGDGVQELERVYADGTSVRTGKLCRFVPFR
jgi:protein-L-isoaspartate(D-aspartate) O-methyltransferase